MIELVFAILTSSFIFVLFKLFPKYSINTFQAIVFNYVTAFTCGFSLYGNLWSTKMIETSNWPAFAVTCGLLFISIFYLMGLSSQKNGLAIYRPAKNMKGSYLPNQNRKVRGLRRIMPMFPWTHFTKHGIWVAGLPRLIMLPTLSPRY